MEQFCIRGGGGLEGACATFLIINILIFVIHERPRTARAKNFGL